MIEYQHMFILLFHDTFDSFSKRFFIRAINVVLVSFPLFDS